jgi:hypothetical protein
MSGTMSVMGPRSDYPWRGAIAAVAVGLSATLLAACDTLTGKTESTTPPIPSLTFDVTTTTTPPSTIAIGPRTTGSESTAPSTQAPLPTTIAVTTTTEPIALQELILTGDGLGSAQFGADPDQVVEYVTSILGSNTADTGWVDPFTFAACEGTIARRVDWGVLSLLFTDLSPVANGRRHFIGYEYGRVGQIGDEPVGLHTPGGNTLGSRVVDLLAEFPEAVINPGEPQSEIPDNFYVSTVFYGLLTGVTQEDYITVLFGGYGCFE